MWSRGRHFRIASRDCGKNTVDSYMSCRFDQGLMVGKEYIGQIEHIVQLNYDMERSILLKCKWWNNNATTWRQSTTLVQDECGFLRVLAKEFMPDHLPRHEPFAFPRDVNQVFVVEDRLNQNWLLVVDTEVRRDCPRIPPLLEDKAEDVDLEVGGGEEVEHDVLVLSDSEEEEMATGMTARIEDNIFEEELITYKRRGKHESYLGPQGNPNNPTDEEDLLSDDEITPGMDDYPTIEA